MASDILVDTSAWYPLIVRTHPDHESVSAALHDAVASGRQVVTTNLIVAETHALLLRRVHRQAALTFVQTVGEPPNLVVRSSDTLETSAITDWLESYSDQAFSFADAVSFAVMADRGMRTALTLDHHFAIAGFEVLPSS